MLYRLPPFVLASTVAFLVAAIRRKPCGIIQSSSCCTHTAESARPADSDVSRPRQGSQKRSGVRSSVLDFLEGVNGNLLRPRASVPFDSLTARSEARL